MRKHKTISVFPLAMITVAAIVSLQNLPIMAEYGLSLVFYLIVAALVFFIPTALVSAELATGWPKKGGVYVWVKEALGPKWGFLAIWLQWIENVVWYPTILAFVSATIAYIFNPEMANNKIYTFLIIIFAFWGTTFVNFFGMKASGLISSISVVIGTILPGLLIIVLGVVYLLSGKPSMVELSWDTFVPEFGHVNRLVFLVGVIFGLAGMEMSAVHAEDVKQPQKNYPKALLIAAFIIILLSILGSLSLAIVVPKEKISLVAGVMEAFSFFFNAYHLSFLVPVIAFLTALGALGMMSTWIVGPSKGLLAAAEHGELPPFLQKINARQMPVALLILQAMIVTILSSLFLFMPTVNSSYWMLTALTAQLYLIMYVLMFISALVLRYKKPHVQRDYKISGGKFGIWLVCSLGIAASLFCILIGFIPPSTFPKENLLYYIAFLAVGILVMCSLPRIISLFKKHKWKAR